jgi:hypothetical protein
MIRAVHIARYRGISGLIADGFALADLRCAARSALSGLV